MFRVMLYSQWKWTRLIVALGSIAAFALPLVSVQGAARADSNPLQAGELLQAVQSWGTLYPVLAAALGLLVAIATWAPDHRGRHVHALSLPLPRWRYVLLRFGAGTTLLAAPVIAASAGALLATPARAQTFQVDAERNGATIIRRPCDGGPCCNTCHVGQPAPDKKPPKHDHGHGHGHGHGHDDH